MPKEPCKHVRHLAGSRTFRCKREAVKEGYCAQHHPTDFAARGNPGLEEFVRKQAERRSKDHQT